VTKDNSLAESSSVLTTGPTSEVTQLTF